MPRKCTIMYLMRNIKVRVYHDRLRAITIFKIYLDGAIPIHPKQGKGGKVPSYSELPEAQKSYHGHSNQPSDREQKARKDFKISSSNAATGHLKNQNNPENKKIEPHEPENLPAVAYKRPIIKTTSVQSNEAHVVRFLSDHEHERNPSSEKQDQMPEKKLNEYSVREEPTQKNNFSPEYQQINNQHIEEELSHSMDKPSKIDEDKEISMQDSKEKPIENTAIEHVYHSPVIKETETGNLKESAPVDQSLEKPETLNDEEIEENYDQEFEGNEGIEEIPDEIRLVPLQVYETEIEKIFLDHTQQITDTMRCSFSSSIDEIIQICNSGQDSRWIQIKKGSSVVGLVAANINGSNFTVRRLQILYFTVTDISFYEEALRLLLDYFWRKDPCDDIWVGLYHMDDENGKLGVNKPIEEAYKKNGFRWKRITNDPDTGYRKTEYAVRRPEGVFSENK